jgi:XRE family transcriptional regulator of biofilm formation
MMNNREGFVILGIRLRCLRQSKGMSLSDLANKAGFTKLYITNLEHAKISNPTFKNIKIIASIFDLSVEELFQPIK